ncbi:MAG: hypothetical protein ACI9TV_000663 [Sulfurimonas sp.]|jgi:hypothetical protein|uniref:hypothetical protein n=1 Tax=Sulfurimonas sp. TaxID=2022749 RepID=UPI0039E3782A
MILKILKKNKILLFVIFLLISVAIIISTNKSNGPNIVKTEVKEETKTLESKNKTTPKIVAEVKPQVKLKKQSQSQTSQENLAENYLLKTPISDDKIDFIGKNDPLIYSKPKLEIDQIMEEHKKITTYGKEKDLTKKEEDWKVDYGVGLEDGAVDDLKTDPTLKSDMVNGKVGFSTSF